MRPTSVSATQIEHRLTGRGPVVLVLKGGHCSRDTRLGHERLAEHGFSVLEASRPGYDRTPVALGCTAEEAADALAGLLDALRIPRVDLVAISAAGHTALELAARHPERVRRIAFEAAMALPWDAATRRRARLLFGPAQAFVWGLVRIGLRLMPSAMLRALLTDLTTLDPAAVVRDMDPATRAQYVALFRSLRSGDGFLCDLGHSSAAVTKLSQPVLILRGRHDRSVPMAHVQRLMALCPDHRYVEVDAETHFIWLGRAGTEVWRRRLAFLRA